MFRLFLETAEGEEDFDTHNKTLRLYFTAKEI